MLNSRFFFRAVWFSISSIRISRNQIKTEAKKTKYRRKVRKEGLAGRVVEADWFRPVGQLGLKRIFSFIIILWRFFFHNNLKGVKLTHRFNRLSYEIHKLWDEQNRETNMPSANVTFDLDVKAYLCPLCIGRREPHNLLCWHGQDHPSVHYLKRRLES
jgi:hypothetical protein